MDLVNSDQPVQSIPTDLELAVRPPSSFPWRLECFDWWEARGSALPASPLDLQARLRRLLSLWCLPPRSVRESAATLFHVKSAPQCLRYLKAATRLGRRFTDSPGDAGFRDENSISREPIPRELAGPIQASVAGARKIKLARAGDCTLEAKSYIRLSLGDYS